MPFSHDLLYPLIHGHARKMKKELKVTLENFIYDPLERVPISFYYDKPPYNFKGYLPGYGSAFINDAINLKVETFSDLGGYWYFDDCQGTVWTVKVPREIMTLVKAEGSPYKRTRCGYWTTDYENFELLANPFWLELEEEDNKWKDYERHLELSNDLDEYEGWNVFKTIRAKVRRRLSSR